ncbi:MAG: Holliday junction resolvase RuvX [Clostridia bacterium]|nr:Holliday junction resolvase RuvX [Clostridia bacterium]
MKTRLLAFDVGERRIGIAVSDALGITAQGVETYTRTGDLDKDISYLLSVAEKFSPVKLVFGLPKNMDGSEGFQAESVREFANAMLMKFDGEHDFYDERLTSVSAHRILTEGNVDSRKHKKVVDKIAAVLILQGYMELHGGLL